VDRSRRVERRLPLPQRPRARLLLAGGEERDQVVRRREPPRDLVGLGSHAEVAKAGKQRLEGKTYVVQDGDVLNIRFNV
jgi:hypothetical protein